MAAEDDTYLGHRIPARSIVIANHFAITREEAVFGKDPDRFMPERWMNEDGSLKELPQTGFGFGRRICTGRHIARNVSIARGCGLWGCGLCAHPLT